jgi:5'-3' exonuclease
MNRPTSQRSSRVKGRRSASRSSPLYKANRKETPPDLLEQIPYVRRVLEAMKIPVLEYPGIRSR